MKHLRKLNPSFISGVVKLAGGYLSPAELDNFFDKIEAELPKYYFTAAAENNLLRILQSFFDKGSLIKDAGKYPVYLEILLSASVNSNYICDILVRDPEYFYWIANPIHLQEKLSGEEYSKSLGDLTARYKSFTSKLNALKSFKRKEILRTGMQDLLGISNLSSITGQLSLLASSILNELFLLCYNEIKNKYNIDFKNTYCLIALGKLGGSELNYSSDTDLMIFYDKDKKYGSRYYSEYLTEIIKLFIDSSSRLTDNGYLYRIDFRLRPDGKNSPLCRSLQKYLSYYESRGESWERQMLIKADYVSGDKSLYLKFIKYLDPFIYPAHQLSSPADQVMKIKDSIEKNLKSDLNIKLTRGGIRDIEFSVQVLQLLNGGSIKKLKQQNTLIALNELADAELISGEEKVVLVNAYSLYRRTEHFLQLMNDRQVHTIPEAGEIVDKMAFFLGYENREKFISFLNETRDKVRKIYLSFIPAGATDPIKGSIFQNKQQAERDLDYLRDGKALSGGKAFDRETQRKFIKLEPMFISLIKKSPDPDLTLRNFTFFIQSTAITSLWYSEFGDETFLKDFLTICTYSKKAIVYLSSDQELQDFMLSKKVFSEYKLTDIASMNIKKVLFYLSVRLALNRISPLDFSKVLSDYCIEVIRKAAELKLKKKNYFVAAMGSLGSGEMNFSSDLDLIFVTHGAKNNSEKIFRSLLADINKELVYFKADCRLRPEGEGSQLSWELDSYINYIRTRARIWELQALSKLEFISGDLNLFNKFIAAAAERIKTEECTSVKVSVLQMREKLSAEGISVYSKNFHLKKSSGGMTDIEFLVQYLILCNIELFEHCRGKNLPAMIDIITAYSEKYTDLKEMKDNFTFFHLTSLIVQSAFDTDKIYYPRDEYRKKLIASYSGYEAEELDRKFEHTIKSTQTVFQKYFN